MIDERGGWGAVAVAFAAVCPRLAAAPAPDPVLVEWERLAGEHLSLSDPLGDARVRDAWAAGADGRGIVVAVVDTGVDVNHEDLAGRCLPGYNALDGSADVADTYGHGTEAALTIAGLRENGKGSAGIAPGAGILPVKVGHIRKAGVYDEVIYGPAIDYDALAKGIAWAADHGAKVLCVAVGGFVSTPALREAVARAQSRGCLVIAPSGAQQESNQDLYPAAYPGVLAVTAWRWKTAPRPHDKDVSRGGAEEDEADAVANYPAIHYGANLSPRTDLAASFFYPLRLDGGKPYGLYGTSCSAAMAAGVAALAWSAAPELSAEEVRRLLKASARPAIGTPGFYEFFDVRIVDALRAVKLAGIAAADAGVRKIECYPLRPLPGQDVSAFVTVENCARGRRERVEVRLAAGSVPLPPAAVALGPWERARVPFAFSAPRGVKRFSMRAECGAAAGELDASDNAMEKTLDVAERAGPLGYVPRLERSEAMHRDPALAFTAEVANVGSAAGDLVAQGEVNDKVAGRVELKGMRIGERREVTFRWTHPGDEAKAFVFTSYVFEKGKERYEDAHDVTSMAFHFHPGEAKAVRQ